jgi:uncharacterized protein YbaR (Trm112 family)
MGQAVFLLSPDRICTAEGEMLDPKLLEILACPQCKGPLTVNPDHTRLTCAACRLCYRIEDDTPIMLLDEAEPQPGEA